MAADVERRWQILIEETGRGGDKARWSYTLSSQTYPDREQARQAALTVAREHRPRHPRRPGARTVLRHDPDNYTVIVEGFSADFHFRVSVGERVE